MGMGSSCSRMGDEVTNYCTYCMNMQIPVYLLPRLWGLESCPQYLPRVAEPGVVFGSGVEAVSATID